MGGGHGLAATLRAVRRYATDITAVVSVADDGGSSGRLRAAFDIPAPGAEGVLFGMGSRFGGHALYVKDNRLHYVNSFVGSIEQHVVGSEDIPTGDNVFLNNRLLEMAGHPHADSIGQKPFDSRFAPGENQKTRSAENCQHAQQQR